MTDGVWLSVSEAAAARGVSKQAISKRLKSLGGRVATRHEGRQLLLNIAEFDRITGAETDPAQALRNRHLDRGDDGAAGAGRGMAPPGPAPQPPRAGDAATEVYSQQKARQTAYAAEMARLDLEERTGKLVTVAAATDAMVRCGSAMVRVIDQLPSRSDDPKIKPLLKDLARELRQTLADEMTLLKAGDARPDTDGADDMDQGE